MPELVRVYMALTSNSSYNVHYRSCYPMLFKAFLAVKKVPGLSTMGRGRFPAPLSLVPLSDVTSPADQRSVGADAAGGGISGVY